MIFTPSRRQPSLIFAIGTAALLGAAILPPLSACGPLSDKGKRDLAAAEGIILAAEQYACAEAEMVAVSVPALEGALIVACPMFIEWTKGAIGKAVVAGSPPAVGEKIAAPVAGARARVVAKVVPGSVRDAGTEGGR